MKVSSYPLLPRIRDIAFDDDTRLDYLSAHKRAIRRRDNAEIAVRDWLYGAADRVATVLGLSGDDFVKVLRELHFAAGDPLIPDALVKRREIYLSRESLAFTGDSGGTGSGEDEAEDLEEGSLLDVARYRQDHSE